MRRPILHYATPILMWLSLGFAGAQPSAPSPDQALSADQLGDLVAPIALYPDPLLSQLLVASTYPLELVQASQWLARNPGLSGAALAQAAENQDWDPSVQALLLFPDLVSRLNQDITWTTNLGNAFLNQQGELMDAVQRMRARAREAGKLSSNSRQNVSDYAEPSESGGQLIDIEPVGPDVIYVPYYDPVLIWGRPSYYPYANWSYPVYGAGISFGFGAGIRIGAYFGGGWGGWGSWGWQPQWRNRSIIVNNNFFYRNNFNRGLGRPNAGRTPWFHDPVHRQAVPYNSPQMNSRFGGNTHRVVRPPGPEQRPAQLGQRNVPGSERMGQRQIPAPAAGRPNVFGGVREGGAARTQSDHGYSSLGPARSGVRGGAPQAPVARPGGNERAAPGQRGGAGERGGQGGGAGSKRGGKQ